MVRVAALALLVSGAACGTSRAASPVADGPVAPVSVDASIETGAALKNHWVPGEKLLWHLSFRDIPVARALMAVGQPGVLDGRRQIIVTSRIETMGVVAALAQVHASLQSWIDLDRGEPTRLDFSAVMPGEEVSGRIDFEPGRLHRTLHRKGRDPKTRTKTIPDGTPVNDVHTVLGFLRGWTPRQGAHTEIIHFDDTQIRRHVIRLTRYELFRNDLGQFPAARIDGVVTRSRTSKSGKPYTVWISDDALRRPLRMEVPTKHGRIVLDLVEYEAPDRRP